VRRSQGGGGFTSGERPDQAGSTRAVVLEDILRRAGDQRLDLKEESEGGVVAPGLPSGGLAAGGGVPSRGEGEVAGVGGEGDAPVRWRGRRRRKAAGRHREGGASALDQAVARRWI
jgi:hypothetical protein